MPIIYSLTFGKSGAKIPSGWLHFAPISRIATFSWPGSGNWPSRSKTCAVAFRGSVPQGKGSSSDRRLRGGCRWYEGPGEVGLG